MLLALTSRSITATNQEDVNRARYRVDASHEMSTLFAFVVPLVVVTLT